MQGMHPCDSQTTILAAGILSSGSNNMPPNVNLHSEYAAQSRNASPIMMSPHPQSHAGVAPLHALSHGQQSSPAMTPHLQHAGNGASNACHSDTGCIGSPVTSVAAISTSSSAERPADYLLDYGRVMTDEQFETLRRQISVYSTICSQLVEMHKALMTQQALMPNTMLVGQQLPFDPVLAARSSGRQRWTPSQIQLQILENVFEKSNGTPSKQRIKEITLELGKHGSISETNVYNWFQNRKARAKRKQQHKDGESEVDIEELDLRKDKRAALQMFQEMDNGMNARGGNMMNGSSGAILNGSPNGGFVGNVSSAHSRTPADSAGGLFNEGAIQRNDHMNKEFRTIVVLIDGKPWEVPSTTLDLKGSFGETSALLDSQRQVVPIDERGFTTRPLHAGHNYTLIKINNGVAV